MTVYTYLVRLPSLPGNMRLIYPLASITGYLASFAFPTVIFIFMNRPDVKQTLGR